MNFFQDDLESTVGANDSSDSSRFSDTVLDASTFSRYKLRISWWIYRVIFLTSLFLWIMASTLIFTRIDIFSVDGPQFFMGNLTFAFFLFPPAMV